MWQCTRCAQINDGSVCSRCGLPAYLGDANFSQNHAAGAYAKQATAAAPVRRKKRKRSAGSFVFCLLALLLTVCAIFQGLQTNYHVTLQVDTTNMSQSLLGVASFVGIDLKGELQKLNYDGDCSVRMLFEDDSAISQASDRLEKMTQQADTALQYMKSYGLVDEDTSWNLSRVNALTGKVDTLRAALKICAVVLGALLLLTLVLLLFGAHHGARTLVSVSALAVGALPILLCLLVNREITGALSSLTTARQLGVGFTASLALTGSGMLQIVLAAGALLCVILSCAFGAFARGKR